MKADTQNRPKETKTAKKARKKTRCFVANDETPFPTFEYLGKLYVSGFDIHSSTKHKKNVKIDNEYRSITEVLKRKGMVVVFLSKELREELPKDLHIHITCNKSGKFVPLEEITKAGGKFHDYLINRMGYKFDTNPAYVIRKCVPQKEVKKKRPNGEGNFNNINKRKKPGNGIPQAVKSPIVTQVDSNSIPEYPSPLPSLFGGSLFDLIDAINKEEAAQRAATQMSFQMFSPHFHNENC